MHISWNSKFRVRKSSYAWFTQRHPFICFLSMLLSFPRGRVEKWWGSWSLQSRQYLFSGSNRKWVPFLVYTIDASRHQRILIITSSTSTSPLWLTGHFPGRHFPLSPTVLASVRQVLAGCGCFTDRHEPTKPSPQVRSFESRNGCQAFFFFTEAIFQAVWKCRHLMTD